MGTRRFAELAASLARRDAGLAPELARVQADMKALRAIAVTSIETFVTEAREHDAEHLTRIDIGPVEPDEKHVDCLQLKIRRGRWEVVCVGKSRGVVTVVGPYQRGKPERPCHDHPLGAEVSATAVQDVLLELIQRASER